MLKNMLKILCLFLLSSSVFSSDKQIYSTIQMLDQVQVINPENLQIEQSVETEFVNSAIDCMDYTSEMNCEMNDNCLWMENHCMDINDSCMDNNSEMECSMSSGCEWMMGMCMESSEDCMSYSTEMECSMSSGCEWMMGMCMESMDDNINTPHFIVLDETNGYWFVTTIASGFVAQYSLLDNSFIDSYFVGDAPALLSVDPISKKLYCSRMMPMNGMGNMMPSSESTIIQSLSYSSMGLESFQEYSIDSPAPHGLAINSDGTEVYTASNTADWLYKIDVENNEVIGVVMDSEVNNTPSQATLRLKPIQCLSVGNKLFVTCSAGIWMNPFTGEQSIIPGKLQMWNSDSMELIDVYDFSDFSAPWHIKESPIDDIVYVALSGDNLYDTEAVASIRYSETEMFLEWETNNINFDTLHGIDVSSDGQYVFVSGRGDGYIHKLDSQGNYLDNVFLGSMSMLGGIAIEKKGLPDLGDLNNDLVFNVTDVVLAVNVIFNSMMSTPYMLYASDLNLDSITNVVDIVQIVSLILD